MPALPAAETIATISDRSSPMEGGPLILLLGGAVIGNVGFWLYTTTLGWLTIRLTDGSAPAAALAAAGVIGVEIELVPQEVAAAITKHVKILTFRWAAARIATGRLSSPPTCSARTPDTTRAIRRPTSGCSTRRETR